jgi:apolipoprotein N-acyltransferase
MKSVPLRLLALAALSALLQLVPFPIAGAVPLWRRFFCWFCLVPLLMACLGRDRQGNSVRPLQATLLGYLCGVLWYAGNCYWIYQTMHIYGNIPELPSFGILILFALYLGLYHALFGWLAAFVRTKYSLPFALFAVPFFWVAIEFTRARITGFPWDLLGYTQVDNSLLTRLAPIGGVMLLSFVVATINALVCWGAMAARLKQPVNKNFSPLFAAVLIVVVLQLPWVTPPLEIGLVQVAVLLQENLAVGAEGRELTPYPIQQKYTDFKEWSLHPHYSPGAPGAKDAKPGLIIWPEAPADFVTTDPLFRAELSGLARTADTPVIVGSVGVDFDPVSPRGYHEFGSAAVFNSEGSYLGRYDKIHRVPWGEYVPYEQFFAFAGKLVSGIGNMEAGTEHKLFQLNGHRVGIFICYESIFGDEVRQFVLNGADVLVNISDDGWYGDSGAPWQHLDMARMRAIENDRWVLRDTNTGITTAIDPHGRGVFTTPRHIRAAFAFPFAYRSGTTFYTRHGDWFAWLCAIASAILLAFSFVRRKVSHRPLIT